MTNKPPLSSLEKTSGPVALLIPGPSMLDDFNNIPEAVTTVSVNHHTVLNLGTTDYIVFADNPHSRWPVPPHQGLQRAIKMQPKGSRISCHKELSDYELDVIWWYGFGSASLAFWFSCFISDKVYVCGLDMCQNKDKHYFHSDLSQKEAYPSAQLPESVDWQIKAWEKAPSVAKKLGTEVIIMSGPGKQLFA